MKLTTPKNGSRSSLYGKAAKAEKQAELVTDASLYAPNAALYARLRAHAAHLRALARELGRIPRPAYLREPPPSIGASRTYAARPGLISRRAHQFPCNGG